MTASALSGYLEEKAAAVRAARPAGDALAAQLQSLRDSLAAAPPVPGLERAIRRRATVALIAEFKRRSPSAPAPYADVESPATIAAAYVGGGAAAVSVLTDAADFGGTLADLAAVSRTVPAPTLRKDFIVDAAGVLEARCAGASAVLLIAAILRTSELAALVASAADVGVDPLVEVHSEEELRRALDAGATLVGINNRDLRTLRTDLRATERVARHAPAGVIIVAESGVRSAADVVRLRDAGAHAVLVGAALLERTGAERAALAAELAGVRR